MAAVPGKTMPPYFAFANEQRPKLKESNPSLSFAEIQKQLPVLWSQLSDEEKQTYKNRPVQAKPTPEPQVTPPKQKEEYTYARIFPKLAPSPMTHYLATQRENVQKEFPLMSRFELNNVLVQRWNDLPQNQKQTYEQHSANDMARYTVEWNEFMVKHPDFDMDDDSDGGEYSPSDDEKLEKEYRKEEEGSGDSGDSGDDDDFDMDS